MKPLTAAVLLVSVSFATFVGADQLAQDEPTARPALEGGMTDTQAPPPMPAAEQRAQAPVQGTPESALTATQTEVPDARSNASDQEVGMARRAYRAQCRRVESADFCECVTAGVAQELPPAEVRLAARTIGSRIGAQGDAAITSSAERTSEPDTIRRITRVEGHYAAACDAYLSE